MTGNHKRKPIVTYDLYKGEEELMEIVQLIEKDLSEPYSVFTYRYFLYNWPELCIIARLHNKLIGVIVCRKERFDSDDLRFHSDGTGENENLNTKHFRGYIAMLAVDKRHRKQGIGSTLVTKAIECMEKEGCEEIFLETEVSNKSAIYLYEKLGFVRDERLVRYYLNGGDAFRLKLWLA